MRVVVQRVCEASVSVDGEIVERIGAGLVVLVGIAAGDSTDDVTAISAKLTSLRIFRDANQKMNRSVVDVSGEILVVSQFTLLADVKKGRRPSWVDAAAPKQAEGLIDELVQRLGEAGVPIRTGLFGASMQVALVNDGPVTIVVDCNQGRIA
jgi:D-tyrosyl-tRNA(Tyr) deacylase